MNKVDRAVFYQRSLLKKQEYYKHIFNQIYTSPTPLICLVELSRAQKYKLTRLSFIQNNAIVATGIQIIM
jgi:hypothetical protein